MGDYNYFGKRIECLPGQKRKSSKANWANVTFIQKVILNFQEDHQEKEMLILTEIELY
jgi:hypothetical protein